MAKKKIIDRPRGRRGKPAENLDYIEASIRHLAVPIDELVADGANVRRHSARNLEVIRRSLSSFRQQTPIVRDADGVVRRGNGTLEAAIALGWTHLAVSTSTLQGAEAQAYAIADNRSGDPEVGSQWDDAALTALLNELQDTGMEVGATGFSDDDLAALAAGAALERPVDLRQLHVNKPPTRTWVLLGIPTVSYGEIAEQVAALAERDDVFCEVCANEDDANRQ